MKYTHLHCHSTYSLLDGANRIPELVKHVKANGMDSIAITDHGNLASVPLLLKSCKAEGVRGIVGMEAYCAPDSRFDRTRTGGRTGKEHSFHLTLLAQTSEGVRNLYRLSSDAFLSGYYYKPRIDKEILAQHAEGIICLSGCVSSEYSDFLLNDDFRAADRYCDWAQHVFPGRFYVEIQDNGVDIQRDHLKRAVDQARRKGLPIVGTSDAHYMTQADSVPHDVLLCVNTGRLVTDPTRMKFSSDQFWVKSPDEMLAAMPAHREALERTYEIADSIEDGYPGLNFGKRQFPSFAVPTQQSPGDYLRDQCQRGIGERYSVVTPEIQARLDHELAIIEKMGFSAYFLILWDIVNWARSQGIPCSARGSAAGSLAAYSLYLSRVCPLRYELLFERFLDPSRSEAPDIDIDVCKDRRDEVYQYIVNKYGSDRVAKIGTYGTLAAKSCIQKVGKAMGVPVEKVEAIKKLIPGTLHITVKDSVDQSEDLRKMMHDDLEVDALILMAQRIEGVESSAGTHAAGVVITDGPLADLCPLMTTTVKEDGKEKGDKVVSTQWDMAGVEAAGLLKLDLLGLRNLSIKEATEQLIRRRGHEYDEFKIPMDDPETFALLQAGHTKGVFQLESPGMRDLLVKMKPDSVDDIIAVVAIYRPGPLTGGVVDQYCDRKHGKEAIELIHPDVDGQLAKSYGLMIYQEDIMKVLNGLGGIPLTESYKVIKAISKKKLADIEKARTAFMSGCNGRGILEVMAKSIFDKIIFFCDYGFNRSHAASYADLAYSTAYLKTRFPFEYMTCLLSSEQEGSDREKFLVSHIEDCRRMGIPILPPDLNRSGVEFILETLP